MGEVMRTIKLIDTKNSNEYTEKLQDDGILPEGVIAVSEDHPFFVGFDKESHYLQWPDAVLVEYTEAEKAARAAEINQAAINAEALAYLAGTDWYIIRQQEAGQAVPADILAARQAARARVVH